MESKLKKIIIISAAAVLVGVFVLMYVLTGSNEPEPVIVEVTEAVTTLPEETEPPETTTTLPLYSEYHSGLYLKAQEAHKINSDVVGWIRISNTNVDYAILQTNDNEFYIDHDINMNKTQDGYIFMDYRNVFVEDVTENSGNLLIYGHNMASGTMFSTLRRYKQSGFYEENPLIELSSLYEDFQYKIYTCILADGAKGSDFEFWNYVNFPMTRSGNAESEFNEFKEKADSHSIFTTGVDLKFGDSLLSLSTCNSGSTTDSTRFVTIARRVRYGEDPLAGTAECVMK